MKFKEHLRRLFVHCTILFLVALLSFNSFHITSISQISTSSATFVPNFLPEVEQVNQPQTNMVVSFIGSGPIEINSIVVEENVLVKGENVKLTINIESEESVTDISLTLILESIPTQYGFEYYQDVNDDATIEPLLLEITIADFCESLAPATPYEKDITFGPNAQDGIEGAHSIQPLNRGSWKFSSIKFSSSSSESTYSFEETTVVHVTFNPHEHIVFAYFVHNNIPIFYNGKTIRDSVDQAIERL